jgi:Holliday junction DNA helicase RuvA
MIHFLRGRLAQKHPTLAVIDCQGVGYAVAISLTTYERLGTVGEETQLLTHLVVREDAHLLFGFADEDERELFLALIGVSGVGANTARMILSAMDAATAREAIRNGDVKAMQRVKGIGTKTAQRILVDLQDKLAALEGLGGTFSLPGGKNILAERNNPRNDALSALVSLGFDRTRCERTLDHIIEQSPSDLPVEALIKQALKSL